MGKSGLDPKSFQLSKALPKAAIDVWRQNWYGEAKYSRYTEENHTGHSKIVV